MSKKAVLITGCSSGIGYVCAHTLQKKGFQVIASCRKEKDVTRLQSEGLTCIRLDLNDPDSITSGAKQALELCNGQLYALFNNGGYGQTGALEDLPTEALRKQFETNFFGWHHLTREILPSMRKQGYGRIIQNSSVLGFAARKYRGAYNASKYAVEGWSDTLRLELHGSDIKVSLIEPGPIDTSFRANALRMFSQWIDMDSSVHCEEYQAQHERLGKKSPAARFVLPADAIVKPLLHALESEHPRHRYRVTTPTKVYAVLKRLLPTYWLDAILRKTS